MENLKMKFKLNGLEFELEGAENTVKEEFANFKDFITSELLSKIIPPLSPTQIIHDDRKTIKIESISEENITSEDYPVLREVVRRDLPKTEKNWGLIYAFYASEFGKKSFTTQDVIKGYRDSGRWTNNRSKKIAENITALLNSQLIKALNDEEFIFKETGIKYAQDILDGTIKVKETKAPARNKSTSKKTEPSDATESKTKTKARTVKAKSIQMERFDIHKDTNTIALEDFLLEKNPSSNTLNNIVVIGYYINIMRGIESFSEGNIDYAYRTLGIKNRPAHLRQIITNAKNTKDFFEPTTDGKWKITRTAEIFVEEKLLNKK